MQQALAGVIDPLNTVHSMAVIQEVNVMFSGIVKGLAATETGISNEMQAAADASAVDAVFAAMATQVFEENGLTVTPGSTVPQGRRSPCPAAARGLSTMRA